MELLRARVPSLSFFKSNIRIFRTSFSENTSIKLLLFFTGDGSACGHKMMTGYLRKKHDVAIAEKRVDTALSIESSQFRNQRISSTSRTVSIIPCRADYFGHKLSIDQNEKLMARLLSTFYVKAFDL